MEGRLAGYVLSHPWMRFCPPALNQVLRTLPAPTDGVYIHDLAVAPWARGTGAGQELAAAALQAARDSSLPRVGLEAVGESEPFWERQGFRGVDRAYLATKLASYGAGARYMEQLLS